MTVQVIFKSGVLKFNNVKLLSFGEFLYKFA